jgi:LruC domain-containing protein
MKHLKWIIPLIVTIILVANSSCTNQDLFDQEKTQEYYDSLSPVDSLDKNHDWLLTESRSITVTANANVNAQWLKILTADPHKEANAEVATQIMISDGETVSLSFSHPKLVTTLYAALIDDQGRFTVTAFSPDDHEVDFSDPLYTKQLISYIPQPLAFIYCYEEEMPDFINLDFDYNDVVMSIAYERTGEREIRFHVALNAVGTDFPVSAALHLKNIKYNDIDSVTTVGKASFNVNSKGEEVPDQLISSNLLKNKEPLLKSKNQEKEEDKEAVINLFCDAHWATGDLLTENYGMIERKRYNVNKGSGTGYQTMVPREVTYIVAFKENVDLDHLTFDLIDPFIIKEYLGGTFEVHQYAYRHDWVLWNYRIADIDKLPWALVIPYKKFRHPLEGVNMGFKKKDIQGFGAYSSVRGHTFGEWSMNRNLAQDWYLNEYATENQVY